MHARYAHIDLESFITGPRPVLPQLIYFFPWLRAAGPFRIIFTYLCEGGFLITFSNTNGVLFLIKLPNDRASVATVSSAFRLLFVRLVIRFLFGFK